ncbi:hypothetical protein ABH935_009045 [Catenulispora sp. GAS73]|uniref:DUF6082 family protein n=1 Tax=Catenulispora sp. GAS73 TaxID=3156269 RepID=UPI00351214B9
MELLMADRDDVKAPDVMRRVFTVRRGSLIVLAFCVGVSFFSVGITALLAVVLGRGLQSQMGTLGQIFESVNAVFSGLGFIALVITFRLQYDELRLQRQELESQRQAMDRTQIQLRRSAKADIRACHVELMRLSMEDAELAAVWPEFQTGLSATCTKQYTYANLIVQHQRMMYDLGFFTEDDVRKQFHYLFTSSTMRGFWEARMVARQVTIRMGSPEWTFDMLVDAAYGDTCLTSAIPNQSDHAADALGGEARSDAA